MCILEKKTVHRYKMGPSPLGRPPSLERPLDNVNLNINVFMSTPDERPSSLKGNFSGAKGMALQEGFHCSVIHIIQI